MRCPLPTVPVYEYTLMPTHMRNLFSLQELKTTELAGPFDFTKGLKTMKIRTGFMRTSNPEQFGTLLFDLQSDPGELNPIRDAAVELRLTNAIRDILIQNDAPAEEYERLSITKEHAMTEADMQAGEEKWDQLTADELICI